MKKTLFNRARDIKHGVLESRMVARMEAENRELTDEETINELEYLTETIPCAGLDTKEKNDIMAAIRYLRKYYSWTFHISHIKEIRISKRTVKITKVFKYLIELSDSNDKDYTKTGLIFAKNKSQAMKNVYEYYRNRTTDYVSPSVGLTEINADENTIIEEL